MKFLSTSLAAVAALSTVNAFVVPQSVTSTTRPTTSLAILSNEQRFDFDNAVGSRTGYSGEAYRNGGASHYPRGESLNYPRYSDGYEYEYPEKTVEGNSRRTFGTSGTDSSTVNLETDGRPLNANVEVWQGSGNTPAKMRLYSEDGLLRPWTAGFANTPRGGYTSSMTIDNEANTAFPIHATNMGGPQGSAYSMSSYVGSSRRDPVNIDGGALKTFSLPPGATIVEVWSDNMPFYADVELWDGPQSTKQAAEVYSDSGYDRPWSAVVENPRGGTISIRNVGPLEYPMKVCVEPVGGYGMGGYGMGRGGGYGMGGYGMGGGYGRGGMGRMW